MAKTNRLLIAHSQRNRSHRFCTCGWNIQLSIVRIKLIHPFWRQHFSLHTRYEANWRQKIKMNETRKKKQRKVLANQHNDGVLKCMQSSPLTPGHAQTAHTAYSVLSAFCRPISRIFNSLVDCDCVGNWVARGLRSNLVRIWKHLWTYKRYNDCIQFRLHDTTLYWITEPTSFCDCKHQTTCNS